MRGRHPNAYARAGGRAVAAALEAAEARRALTQHTTDELEDPTTEGDRRREIEAEDRAEAGECGRDGCAGYKPDHDHELAF